MTADGRERVCSVCHRSDPVNADGSVSMHFYSPPVMCPGVGSPAVPR